jgi:hypothetical protein
MSAALRPDFGDRVDALLDVRRRADTAFVVDFEDHFAGANARIGGRAIRLDGGDDNTFTGFGRRDRQAEILERGLGFLVRARTVRRPPLVGARQFTEFDIGPWSAPRRGEGS